MEKNIIENLEGSIKELQTLLDVKLDFKLLLYKKVEDGILDNLKNASIEQLKKLKNYKWRYYTSLNNNENLCSEIKKRLRLVKLNNLLINEI